MSTLSHVGRSRYYIGESFVVEHRASDSVAPTAILVLPPLGYEDTSAYRPLRVLADALAADGHLVVRLDWPGLGDSGLGGSEAEVVAHCLQSIRKAADGLRARGFRDVAAVGIRGGALLALAAEGLGDLVLWALPVSGKAYLREERAFHAMAAAAFGAKPEGVPCLPAGAVEAGGFVYAPETVSALHGLVATDLASRSGARRVLLIERRGGAASEPLVQALGANGARVETITSPGLADLLEDPYQAKLGRDLQDAIVAWFATQERCAPAPAAGATQLASGGVIERPWVAQGGAGELSGIVCEPVGGATAGAVWTIFFNAGGVRRSGPNRMWTRAARALAEGGRPSLRFDVRDVGDSDGANEPHADLEAMYSQASVDDGLLACDTVQGWGAGAIDVVGLCSGAFLGAQVALRRPVRRALLFNGLALVWNDDARAFGVTAQIGRSLLDTRRWQRLLTGRINARHVARALVDKARLAVADAVARARGRAPEDEVHVLLRAVRARGTDIQLVASEGDPSIAYLHRHVPEGERPRLTILPGVDHTLRPAWAHDRVLALVIGDGTSN